MPYTYKLTSVIPASPQEIYEAWLDSEEHSQMTGAEARMSGHVGGEFSAWDDHIKGRNLELVPAERIVQSWRTSKFTDQHEDSIVTITLEEAEDGTLLTLVHSNVPDEHRSYEEGGWESNYFAPMRAYFASLDEDEDTDAEEFDDEEEEGEDEEEDEEEDEDDDEEDEDDGGEEDDEDDGDEGEEDDEDEDEEDEEDEDEEAKLREGLADQRQAKEPEVQGRAAPKPRPEVKRATRSAKKAAPKGKISPRKKTKRAGAANRKSKLKPKTKKKAAAKRARPAGKKTKRAAAKKQSARRKRGRR